MSVRAGQFQVAAELFELDIDRIGALRDRVREPGGCDRIPHSRAIRGARRRQWAAARVRDRPTSSAIPAATVIASSRRGATSASAG